METGVIAQKGPPDCFIRHHRTNHSIGITDVPFVRRYWAASLILLMVAVHAAVIGYVRSRVSQLGDVETAAFDLGNYRFQSVDDSSTVYHFQLHAAIDPSKLYRGRERLTVMQMEICEASEQLLRQADPTWLNDPAQTQIRERLMEIIQSHLDEDLVERVLITDWLELPVGNVDIALARSPRT